jgi:SAM-dependent methyltransferase
MNSSSIHQLNADQPLNIWSRRLWYKANKLNNAFFPNLRSRALHIKRFVPDLSTQFLSQVDPKSSPSRSLSDLFWMQLPWSDIHAKLGPLHVMDVGCGSGRYGEELQKHSGGRIESYLGLDEFVHSDWPARMQANSFIKLQQADSADFASKIPKNTNLFVSQSAIEHFPQDLTFFRQVRDFLNSVNRPSLQFHLFPTAACLPLYKFHGIRQYTPRTVSLISGLFENFDNVLFELGNSLCNQVHWRFITKPVIEDGKADLREAEPEAYRKELLAALASTSDDSSPSFYALVIESRHEPHVFAL